MKTHHLWLILLAVTFTFIVTFPSMGQQSFDFISSVKNIGQYLLTQFLLVIPFI